MKKCIARLILLGLVAWSTIGNAQPLVQELAVWRPSDGVWYILTLNSEVFTRHWGRQGDIQLGGADFDGDGISDMVVWRPSNGVWYVLTSKSGFSTSFERQWGVQGDIPLRGSDFDGDGISDMVVWRPSNGVWYVLTSTSGFSTSFERRGVCRGTPHCEAPISMAMGSLTWWCGGPRWGLVCADVHKRLFHFIHTPLGCAGDSPLRGSDFDGDGITDIAVWRAQSWGVVCADVQKRLLHFLRTPLGCAGGHPIGRLRFRWRWDH